MSPLQSRADTHPSQDACPMNSSSDSMCGNKRPGKIAVQVSISTYICTVLEFRYQGSNDDGCKLVVN